MKVWQFINNSLQAGKDIMLLYVVKSEGSSPGRQGFKMAVNVNGDFVGTIGGGIMEHKLVELSKDLLGKGMDGQSKKVQLKQQYHDKAQAKYQSGMICSGEQLIAFVPLNKTDLPTIEKIVLLLNSPAEQHNSNVSLNTRIVLSQQGLFIESIDKGSPFIDFTEGNNWKYSESLIQQKRIHIFGGGHVGLALSKVMRLLDYWVIVYDDRADLNTMETNEDAHQKHVLDYAKVNEYMDSRESDCVAIVTFGYRSDKTVLKQLYKNKYAYIGMMGSDAKIETLYKELEEEGITRKELAHVHAPIGMDIYSKNTMEIAISIAGQIIKEQNKNLPTGRNYSNE